MLPKLSVKKPMTIFVAVIVVIVLGIVSVFKMTPDLLPNMDFPYAIILTTYPGQTPETVESVVTKPLEQSLSTIDGVKTITSTSSDNYSMLTLEFEDGTNLDTATVDMRGNLDTIKDAWPDGVGSPYLMKINPNMMPVAMVAVDYDGYDTVQISDYVNNKLKKRVSGICLYDYEFAAICRNIGKALLSAVSRPAKLSDLFVRYGVQLEQTVKI